MMQFFDSITAFFADRGLTKQQLQRHEKEIDELDAVQDRLRIEVEALNTRINAIIGRLDRIETYMRRIVSDALDKSG